MTAGSRTPIRWLALLAALALVALAYLPGLRGPFVFDDYPNILNNPPVAVTELTPQALHAAAVSNTSGPLGRPLAALSFGIDHYRAGGFNPLAFKLTNLAIHLLNVLLVYALAGRLTRRLGAGEIAPAVALFCALLWGLHPLQLTSVLYVVQRMTSLSATFTLAAVLCWLQARERWGGSGAGELASLPVGAGHARDRDATPGHDDAHLPTAAVAAMGRSYNQDLAQSPVGAGHARDRDVTPGHDDAHLPTAAVAAMGRSYNQDRAQSPVGAGHARDRDAATGHDDAHLPTAAVAAMGRSYNQDRAQAPVGAGHARDRDATPGHDDAHLPTAAVAAMGRSYTPDLAQSAVGAGQWDRLPALGWLLACGAFFVLGLLSKENAVLLPLYLAVIELCLWRQAGAASAHDPGRRAATWFFVVTLLAPLLVGLALFAWHPGLLLDGYASRPFTLGQRLLTESRVLWFYVGLVLLPTPPRLGLYHDDIAISTGLLDPWTTLLSLDGWLVVLMAAILLRRRAPVFTFGVLWFLAGHALESTLVPLEIAHEHRNYLPGFGLLFAAVYGVATFAQHTRRGRLYGVLGLAAVAAFAFGTFGRAASWYSEDTIIEALYRHHPQSASAQQMMGELMLKRYGQPAQAAVHYWQAYKLAPWETGYAVKARWAERAAGEPAPNVAERAVIAKALRERPLPPTTLIALQSLGDCALAGEAPCRDLIPALLDWLAAAERNPQLNAVGHEQVRLSYGQLCLETDRFPQGLAWVRSAYQLSPRPLYRLMEANFLMLQGDLDGASAVLAAVRSLPQFTPADAGHLAVLEEAIANRRAGKVPAADGSGAQKRGIPAYGVN